MTKMLRSRNNDIDKFEIMAQYQVVTTQAYMENEDILSISCKQKITHLKF